MGYGAWATRPPAYFYMQCREKICIFKTCSIFLYITIKNGTHLPYLRSLLYIRSPPLQVRSLLYIHEYSRISINSLILYSGEVGVYEPPVPISTYYRGRFTICQVFSLFIFSLTCLYL